MTLIERFTSLSKDILPSKRVRDISKKISEHMESDITNAKDVINYILRTEILSRPSTSDEEIRDRTDMICILSAPSIHDDPFLEDCEEVLNYIKDK